MKNIEATGTYKVKETGDEITYSYSYDVIDSLQDAVDNLGDDKVKSSLQRMLKVDANNIAREKAKTSNGHSTRVMLTEEQKSENKTKRAGDRVLLALLKSKGLTLADVEGM